MHLLDCSQVDVAAGLLVVGHKQGEARVYQFSGEEQEVSCLDLDGKQAGGQQHTRHQPPGFQCILQCSHHAATISGVALACALRLVALADETGLVSILDLTQVGHSHPSSWVLTISVVGGKERLCR